MNKGVAIAVGLGLGAAALAATSGAQAGQRPEDKPPEDKPPEDKPPLGRPDPDQPGGDESPIASPADQALASAELGAFALLDDTAIAVAQASLSVTFAEVLGTAGLEKFRSELANVTEAQIADYGMALTSPAATKDGIADQLALVAPQMANQLLALAAAQQAGAGNLTDDMVTMVRAVAEEGSSEPTEDPDLPGPPTGVELQQEGLPASSPGFEYVALRLYRWEVPWWAPSRGEWKEIGDWRIVICQIGADIRSKQGWFNCSPMPSELRQRPRPWYMGDLWTWRPFSGGGDWIHKGSVRNR